MVADNHDTDWSTYWFRRRHPYHTLRTAEAPGRREVHASMFPPHSAMHTSFHPGGVPNWAMWDRPGWQADRIETARIPFLSWIEALITGRS